MDLLKSELDGAWLNSILGILIDAATLLFLLFGLTTTLFFYLQKRKRLDLKRGFSPFLVIASSLLFIIYFLGIRPLILNSILFSIIYTATLISVTVWVPIIFDQERHFRVQLFKLFIVVILRRSFSLIFALFASILSLPLIILCTIWIKITAPWQPIFIRHIALSRSGKAVILYNFRTRDLYTKPYELPPFLLTSLTDPQTSRFGTFLRKTGLHALPRLLNVLKGDIYLIGVSPLYRGEMLSDLGMKILKEDSDSIEKLYPVENEKVFHRIVEHSLPLGMITYAELYSYHVRIWQAKVIKDRDLRTRITQEAEYFLGTRLASTKLFGRFLLKAVFRVLYKLEEARGPLYESSR